MMIRPVPRRRNKLRLQGADYTQPGAYYVTICTNERQCLFGEVIEGCVLKNTLGQAVTDEWLRTAEIRREVSLDAWVVMPNHLHGIVVIGHPTDRKGGGPLAAIDSRRLDATGAIAAEVGRTAERLVPSGPRPGSLGAIIAGFKSATTRRINELRRTPGMPVWQRNYYEHIIRDERTLGRIREYIINNPLQWALDRENPVNAKRP